MEPESPDDLLNYLTGLGLDAELSTELRRCRTGWVAWLDSTPTPAISWREVLRGLSYLGGDAADRLPAPRVIGDDYDLVAALPRLAALCLLFKYLLLHADRFNLSLLRWLQPLEERTQLLPPVAARLAALAAAADMPARAAARGLRDYLLQAARERLRDLIFAEPVGVFVADLADLAYDLRLTGFEHQGYSFSLQSFYGPVSVVGEEAEPPLLLPADGTRFDAEGYLHPPGSESPSAWTARTHRRVGFVEANGHIGEDGLCRRGIIRVEATTPMLMQPGDEAIEMHIERGADLTPSTFASAVDAAFDHYRRHFPEVQPRAVFMVSWLLDPVLRQLLPAETRLRRFQDLFHLYPARYDEDYARDCVMVGHTDNRLTRLQRAVLHLEAAGGKLREGGGFRLLPR